jgi:hypothetical protein
VHYVLVALVRDVEEKILQEWARILCCKRHLVVGAQGGDRPNEIEHVVRRSYLENWLLLMMLVFLVKRLASISGRDALELF